jgi:nitrogen fixation protein FixH
MVAAIATALGAVVATIWIGASLKEGTVVADPYEEGLRYDAERRARERLGWEVRTEEPVPAAGGIELRFDIVDRAGAPVEGASVIVSTGRRDTSRGVRLLAARALGAGRYAVELPRADGAHLLRFDVRRGADRVRIERTLELAGAPPRHGEGPSCDVGRGPCTRPLPSGADVTLELGPRPLGTMRELAVTARVRDGAGPVERASVSVAFDMKGMEMGPNTTPLAPAGRGEWVGKAVLVRCPSGRKDWTATVSVARPGAAPEPEVVRFDLTVVE